MKKITEKTRIKVLIRIGKEFGISYWNRSGLKYEMRLKFGLEFTSKRDAVFYYKPTCEHKLMLFAIQYNEYIINK